jgi:hypothetical protein
MTKLHERTARANTALAEKRRLEAATPRQMYLPGLKAYMRAMPNHLARSSVFAPLSKNQPRKFLNNHLVVTRSDAVIKFTGEQLDEGQADVWMQLMDLAKFSMGESFMIHSAALLHAIGRHVGGTEYRWLRRAIEALYKATLIIAIINKDEHKISIGDADTDGDGIRMIDRFKYDSRRKEYTLAMDPRWIEMYANRQFALIDWEKRLAIRQGQDMAKTLQRLVATSADKVQRNNLAWLQAKLQYASPIRKFRVSLLTAMRELERVEIIAGAHIDLSTRGNEQAVWTKL